MKTLSRSLGVQGQPTQQNKRRALPVRLGTQPLEGSPRIDRNMNIQVNDSNISHLPVTQSPTFSSKWSTLCCCCSGCGTFGRESEDEIV